MTEPSDAKPSELIDLFEAVWRKGVIPQGKLPGSAEDQARLEHLLGDIRLVQDFALAISNGNLNAVIKVKGQTAGSLKSLQASLRHLSWQAQMIAQGDFSQRVDFMGEFADAFNTMVYRLEEARNQIQEREKDLIRLNDELRAEIEERILVEQALTQANERLKTNLDEIESLQARLRDQAIRDPLTNLYNRRYMVETLERELNIARRARHPISILMLDIDYFKRLNDTFGHQVGDSMLVVLGNMLPRMIRDHDVACRYGGEEFVVVMPGASLEVARERGEQIRATFENSGVDDGRGRVQATISIGVAAFPKHGNDGDSVLQSADRALYAAKDGGRNRVVVAG